MSLDYILFNLWLVLDIEFKLTIVSNKIIYIQVWNIYIYTSFLMTHSNEKEIRRKKSSKVELTVTILHQSTINSAWVEFVCRIIAFNQSSIQDPFPLLSIVDCF